MDTLTPYQKVKLFKRGLDKCLPKNYKHWEFALTWVILEYYFCKKYPSASKINLTLLRPKNRGLNGRECKLRTKIFKKLGIKKKVNQY